VLRIDSGGGSAVASETIREALQDVRAHGKPVVVSMSNTAASGGYWIAMAADRIVAQPGTLTGSIGVVAGKPVLAEAWRKLGVNWAEITRGANAGIWTVNEPYSAEARARVDALVGWLYDRFTRLVSDARLMPQQRVQELAKGRVWAGAAAAQLGLVDELGGLDESLAAVRRVLKLPADTQLSVEPRPLDHNPAHQLLRLLRPLAGSIELALGLGHGLGAGTAMSLPVEVR
jgi:protease IV